MIWKARGGGRPLLLFFWLLVEKEEVVPNRVTMAEILMDGCMMCVDIVIL